MSIPQNYNMKKFANPSRTVNHHSPHFQSTSGSAIDRMSHRQNIKSQLDKYTLENESENVGDDVIYNKDRNVNKSNSNREIPKQYRQANEVVSYKVNEHLGNPRFNELVNRHC